MRLSFRLLSPIKRSFRACATITSCPARLTAESGEHVEHGEGLRYLPRTGPLKSRDEVVGLQNCYQIGRVRRDTTRGHLPERIVLAMVSQPWLRSAARDVEVPRPPRRQRH